MTVKLTKIFYHLFSTFYCLLIRLIPISKYDKDKNHVIYITPYAVRYDGRVRRSIDALLSKGFTVNLIKPADCLDDDVESWHPQLSIVPVGYFRSYAHFPYIFDINVMRYLLKSSAAQIYCRDIYTGMMGIINGHMTHKKITVDFFEWVSETKDYKHNIQTTCRKPWWKKKLFQYYERYICRYADRLITNNVSFAEGINQGKAPIEKFTIIRNIPKYSALNPRLTLKDFLSDNQRTKKILYYVGQLSFDRKLDTIILGMHYVDDCLLIIQGTGHLAVKMKYQYLLDQYNLNEKIIFLPPICAKDIISYAASADVGVFICDTEDNKMHHALPNKLFEYVYAEIPQVSSQGIEVDKLLTKYKIGLLFDAYNPMEFADKIKKIVEPRLYNEVKKSTIEYKQILCQQDDFDLI